MVLDGYLTFAIFLLLISEQTHTEKVELGLRNANTWTDTMDSDKVAFY